ncbi:hypothetical protein J6590_038866 [Homalodisca vitripennis]|nr:hypothetical protein J6590_038866 [Homalodisca vitripennis]
MKVEGDLEAIDVKSNASDEQQFSERNATITVSARMSSCAKAGLIIESWKGLRTSATDRQTDCSTRLERLPPPRPAQSAVPRSHRGVDPILQCRCLRELQGRLYTVDLSRIKRGVETMGLPPTDRECQTDKSFF